MALRLTERDVNTVKDDELDQCALCDAEGTGFEQTVSGEVVTTYCPECAASWERAMRFAEEFVEVDA